MQKPVHPSFEWVKLLWMGRIWMDGWWTGGGRVKKRMRNKRYSKTIDIVSYALKVSVNCVTRVCNLFQVVIHISAG